MKLYGYAVVKCRDNTDNNGLHKISFSREVKENPGTYENIGENTFYSNWDDFLPKSEIAKVQKNVYGTNIKYLVYLLEDDKVKAMSLIKQTIQNEIDELYKQINCKQEFLGIACGSTCEIKKI